MNYYCSSCKKNITFDEYDYSKKYFNKALCRQHQPTKEAMLLFNALKKEGVPAKIEWNDGHKSVDISVPEARVDIEVDGGQHNFNAKVALSDLKRTYYSFKKKNYLTLRIPNRLVTEYLNETTKYIVHFLNESNEGQEDEDDGFLSNLFRNIF